MNIYAFAIILLLNVRIHFQTYASRLPYYALLPCQVIDIPPALQQRPANAVEPSSRFLFVVVVFNIGYHLFGGAAIARREWLVPR
jgi:hypothetical protein